ncbi:ACT domain-containing protein [Amycolatopsis sp. EV170708-02-1]|uniref:ACT domain-containing protein n=1 Tax=Amycolatopsis sp. EV170708-02-1 TaxID=2919322 RepID=UPI001F0C1369|nr:ACT domain-containing protein [Amycolatopsis sp. EV170708-02-1]UMP00075.1 hypothetical protein MJQ72_26625 [Amycolatopsis sp. EV170708-02-1]
MTEPVHAPRSHRGFPAYRSLTVHVTDRLDGAARVVMLLRARSYRVRDMTVEVREGVVESRVQCTVWLGRDDVELLLCRLRRMPGVVSAEKR